MATLNSTKKERFARFLAQGENAVQAYIKAGYSEKGAGANAHKLKSKPEITTRVAEIIAGKLRAGDAVPGAGTTKEMPLAGEWDWNGEVPLSYIRQRLAEMHDQALRDGEFSDALNALKMLGQTIGLFAQGANRQMLPPPKEPGRPRIPDAPDSPGKNRRHDNSRPSIAVQVINRVTSGVGGRAGDQSQDEATDTIDAIATVVRALPDGGPIAFDGCGGGDEGEDRAGVPVEAGGEGA